MAVRQAFSDVSGCWSVDVTKSILGQGRLPSILRGRRIAESGKGQEGRYVRSRSPGNRQKQSE